MNKKHIFIAMYRALDCIYDENPSEKLRFFLSAANPYIFTDRNSADPAVLAEFNNYIDDNYDYDNNDDSYNIVKAYLNYIGLSDYFKDISIDEWKALCKVIADEEQTYKSTV